MPSYSFLKNKKIFITGNTGFIGSWLSIILILFGAKLTGFSKPLTKENVLFKNFKLQKKYKTYFGNIENYKKVKTALKDSNPEIIIHLASQPIVFESLKEPIKTLNTNIIGAANVLKASLTLNHLSNIIIFTSDKVYENNNLKNHHHVESDKLGGDDIYSASKACQDILTYSFFKSFIENKKNIKVNTIRSGNIIGGLDYGKYRLVPDIVKFLKNNKKVFSLRNPNATRPWQHVLEPCFGMIKLIEYNRKIKSSNFSAFNFAPNKKSQISVKNFTNLFIKNSKKNYKLTYKINKNSSEKKYLSILGNKAKLILNFKNKLSIKEAIKLTYDIYLLKSLSDIEKEVYKQINFYLNKS